MITLNSLLSTPPLPVTQLGAGIPMHTLSRVFLRDSLSKCDFVSHVNLSSITQTDRVCSFRGIEPLNGSTERSTELTPKSRRSLTAARVSLAELLISNVLKTLGFTATSIRLAKIDWESRDRAQNSFRKRNESQRIPFFVEH